MDNKRTEPYLTERGHFYGSIEPYVNLFLYPRQDVTPVCKVVYVDRLKQYHSDPEKLLAGAFVVDKKVGVKVRLLVTVAGSLTQGITHNKNIWNLNELFAFSFYDIAFAPQKLLYSFNITPEFQTLVLQPPHEPQEDLIYYNTKRNFLYTMLIDCLGQSIVVPMVKMLGWGPTSAPRRLFQFDLTIIDVSIDPN